MGASAFKDVSQVGERVDAESVACGDEAGQDRRRPPAVVAPMEHPVFPISIQNLHSVTPPVAEHQQYLGTICRATSLSLPRFLVSASIEISQWPSSNLEVSGNPPIERIAKSNFCAHCRKEFGPAFYYFRHEPDIGMQDLVRPHVTCSCSQHCVAWSWLHFAIWFCCGRADSPEGLKECGQNFRTAHRCGSS